MINQSMTKEARIYSGGGGETDSSISRFWANRPAACKRMKPEIFLTVWIKITQNALKTKM